MAVERQYFRDTQLEPGTGGNADYDLSATQGSPGADLRGQTNGGSFTPVLTFRRALGDAVSGTSFPVSVNVTSTQGSLEYRFRLVQILSGGGVGATSAYSSTFTSSGTQTDTLSLSPTWGAGDSLAVEFELRKTGGGGGQVRAEVGVQNASSYVDADLAAPPEEHSGSASVSGGGLVTLAGAAAMAGALLLSGGGEVTATGSTQRGGAVTVSGGGSVVASGGAESFDASGSATVSGGGAVTAAGQPGHAGAAAVSGGGQVIASGTARRLGSATVSGGGSVTASGGSEEAPVTGSATVTGGGSVTAAGTKASAGAAVVSGGGSVVLSGAGTGEPVAPGSNIVYPPMQALLRPLLHAGMCRAKDGT